jgi:hypothetical protein
LSEEVGASAMPRNRVRKMVKLIFAAYTYQPLCQPLLYQVATSNQELILSNDGMKPQAVDRAAESR